jgi:uncharacterized membrane protein YjgN (DUF898 family)
MNEVPIPPFGVDPPPGAVPHRVAFYGIRTDFVRLVARGALLELVTIGFYRFWLATDMRRHLWSSTSVSGDAAEYTGTAKELLIGFLFAVAILAPIYLVYFLIGLEAEQLQAFASIPLGLFFYLFAQFAIYRARRYRLTRTVWRGVRFWMTGSGVSYAWRAGLWALLVLVTLGLALPWARASLEGYKMRHTAYGDLRGRFEASGWELFRRGWWLWLLAWLSLSPLTLAIILVPRFRLTLFPLLSLTFFILLIIPFIYAAFKVIEWRWWVSGLRMGDVRFQSDLAAGDFVDLYWKWVGWVALLLVGLAMWYGIVVGLGYGYTDPRLTTAERFIIASQQIPVLIGLGVGYFAVALASGAVMRIYLMRDLWERIANSVTIHNLEAAENVAARGDTVSALGEGFADSLEMTGF